MSNKSRARNKNPVDTRKMLEIANNTKVMEAKVGSDKISGVVPPNPAEQAVNAHQREQAMQLLKMMAGNNNSPQYQPVLKSLKAIGVKIRKMTVMVGEEPEDCIVIPVQELMSREWAHLNEIEETDQIGDKE